MSEDLCKIELERDCFSLVASHYVSANAIVREVTHGSPLSVTLAMKFYEQSLLSLLRIICKASGRSLCGYVSDIQFFNIFRETVLSNPELFSLVSDIVSGGLSSRVDTDTQSPDILFGVVRLYAKATYTLLYFVSESFGVNFIPESFREVFRGAGLDWELKYLGRRIDADYSVRWAK